MFFTAHAPHVQTTYVDVELASNSVCHETSCREAFGLFQRVRAKCNAKPFPVLLLDKPESAFTPEATLLARSSVYGLVGVALLQRLPEAAADMSAVSRKFGELAVNKLRPLLPRENETPLYEIGSIAVETDATCRGIGRALYAAAAEITNGRCLATINVENSVSRRAAEAAGFVLVPDSCHTVNFSLLEGKPQPNPQGPHVQEAQFFVYSPAAARAYSVEKPGKVRIFLPEVA